MGAWLGNLEITIGSSKPVAAASGQAFFIEKGTAHGFRNVGDTAAVLEIFVKDGASAAKIRALGVTPGALAKTVNASTGQIRSLDSRSGFC